MTRVAIRRKIIKINKIMGARVYAHARKGFIATLVTGKTKKNDLEALIFTLSRV